MASRKSIEQVLWDLEWRGPDALPDLAKEEPIPIVRDREVIFLYNDPTGKVKQIRLVHHVSGLPRSPLFEKIHDKGLFLLHMVLPRGARLEYTFRVSRGKRDDRIHPDPMNPKAAYCPFGPKSVVETETYHTPSWVRHRDDVPHGTLEDHSIKSRYTKDRRYFTVYVPGVKPPRGGYSLLVVHDGGDYRNYADLVTSLDNLIADGAISPILAVLTHPRYRNHEYACTPRHPSYIVEELLPWIRKKYHVSTRRSKTGLMGASFGAIASIYGAYSYPDVFEPLLLQSGSFFFHHAIGIQSRFQPVDEFDRIRLFLESEFFPLGPARLMKVYLSCGTFESILPHNQTFARMMAEAGHSIAFRESHDGHNWVSWRDHFGNGLSYLFPPKARRRATGLRPRSVMPPTAP